MNEKQFRTSKGRLTSYALACGYIEKYYDNNQTATLWHEGNIYHVRHFDHKMIVWHVDGCYESLTTARQVYDTAVKQIKASMKG